jgi:hypothetical protein
LRCTSVLALPLLLLLVVSAFCARITRWPGWRGGELEGRAQCRSAPVHWSSDRNIVWRTAIPGEGHSSPIVCGGSVYLTTSLDVPQNDVLLLLSRLTQLAGLVLIALLCTGLVAQSSASRPNGHERSRSMVGSILFLAMGLALSAVIIFGESALDFMRAPERPWMASCLVGSVCLALLAVDSKVRPKSSAVAGLALLAFSGVLGATIPDPAHTIHEKPFSDASLFVYAVIAIPALVGLGLITRFLGRPGRGTGQAVARAVSTAKWTFGLLALLILPALAALVALHQGQSGSTISVGSP